jgi:hypothetical protein
MNRYKVIVVACVVAAALGFGVNFITTNLLIDSIGGLMVLLSAVVGIPIYFHKVRTHDDHHHSS